MQVERYCIYHTENYPYIYDLCFPCGTTLYLQYDNTHPKGVMQAGIASHPLSSKTRDVTLHQSIDSDTNTHFEFTAFSFGTISNFLLEKLVYSLDSLKIMKQTEKVFPDPEGVVLGPQRWTSCGEENILSWIRGMFVYSSRCAAPTLGEGWISWKERKANQQLCNIHQIWKGLEAAGYGMLLERVEYSAWRGQNRAAQWTVHTDIWGFLKGFFFQLDSENLCMKMQPWHRPSILDLSAYSLEFSWFL